MTFILKMKKVVFMTSLSIFLVGTTAIPAFASSHSLNHSETNANKTGDIIDGPNGKEVVVSSLEDGVCGQCGKTGFKIYDRTWRNVKHKHKLFGDTCTVCGYVK